MSSSSHLLLSGLGMITLHSSLLCSLITFNVLLDLSQLAWSNLWTPPYTSATWTTKKSLHLHVSGWILWTSEPTFHRNCDSWISCHHPKSAGRTQTRENLRIIKVGKDLQDCQVQPKITGTQPNHAKALTGLKVLLQCSQPSRTWAQEGKPSHKVTVTNVMREKKYIYTWKNCNHSGPCWFL